MTIVAHESGFENNEEINEQREKQCKFLPDLGFTTVTQH
ncbi:hypothetical protein RSK60_90023 [Ralstonia solanacearum K60]|nr:hypothetical protein RSK60_90023 [Ralstonia solanacearum K60]